jgi:hypothetical protein
VILNFKISNFFFSFKFSGRRTPSNFPLQQKMSTTHKFNDKLYHRIRNKLSKSLSSNHRQTFITNEQIQLDRLSQLPNQSYHQNSTSLLLTSNNNNNSNSVPKFNRNKSSTSINNTFYKDKIDDKKLFNRNYKLNNNNNEIINTFRSTNSSSSPQSPKETTYLNSNKSATTNTKIKLLKKRDAMKKAAATATATAATTTTTTTTTPDIQISSLRSLSNHRLNNPLYLSIDSLLSHFAPSNKYEINKQIDKNNNSRSVASLYPSNYKSMNDLPKLLNGKDQNKQLQRGLTMIETTTKSNQDLNSFQRRLVASTPLTPIETRRPITQIFTKTTTPPTQLNLNSNYTRTEYFDYNDNKSTQSNKEEEQQQHQQRVEDEIIEDFKIMFPNQGFNADARTLASSRNGNNSTSNLMLITNNHNDISKFADFDFIHPNNIMSNPDVRDQFRRLYVQDEYFQQIDKKCTEWLNKYI